MPQLACPYCDEVVRYISRDTLPSILGKHLRESPDHQAGEEFEDVESAVQEALQSLDA